MSTQTLQASTGNMEEHNYMCMWFEFVNEFQLISLHFSKKEIFIHAHLHYQFYFEKWMNFVLQLQKKLGFF
jgi:hypothetical protein